jgi:hypothetical protein
MSGGFNPPSRRPRSQVQQSHAGLGRRRSSGSNTANNSNSPGTAGQRRTSGNNRWSYDPYNLHQTRTSVHQHPAVSLC